MVMMNMETFERLPEAGADGGPGCFWDMAM
jgi:hypothetical protein